MTLKVYQAIQDQVLQPFQDFAANGAGQISSEVGRTLTAAMTVYICWYGWMILRGSIQEPVQEFTVSLDLLMDRSFRMFNFLLNSSSWINNSFLK